MATPIPLLGQAASLRPQLPGNPPWTCISAQVFDQAPAGTRMQVERVGVSAFSIFGINIGDAPSPTAIRNGLLSGGHASRVYYVEAWAQDGRVLGTGVVTWWFIAVYS